MWCQCDYKSNIRTDCIHYHCEQDIGASIDCCTLKGLGNCPCSNDCKDYVNKNEVYRLGLEVFRQRGEHDDLISRAAAIDSVEIFLKQTDAPEVYPGLIPALARVINNVPSAQPERKKGKWVGYDGDWLKTMCKCSKCGAMIDINEKYRNFFCYHCGARMDGEQDE